MDVGMFVCFLHHFCNGSTCYMTILYSEDKRGKRDGVYLS